jgi:hypothetical protein
VEDIIGLQKPRPHTITPFAHVKGTQITYPPLVTESGE